MRQQTVGLTSGKTCFGPPPSGPQPSWILNKYEDSAWQYIDIYGRQFEIDFTSVPVGFRALSKQFIWALEYVTDQRVTRVPMTSISSFVGNFFLFKSYIDVCVFEGIECLHDMDRETADRIVLKMTTTRTRRGIRTSSSFKRIDMLLHRLYWLGPAGIGMIGDGLSFSYEKGYRPKGVEFAPGGSTATMPDEVAQALLFSAVDFLKYARAILYCYEQEVAFRDHLGGRRRRYHMRDMVEHRLKYFMTSGVRAEVRKCLKSLTPLMPLTSLEKDMKAGKLAADLFYEPVDALIGFRYLNVFVRHMTAAAYCVVGGFTGFRAGEILNMREGDTFVRGTRTMIRTQVTKTAKVKGGVSSERSAPPIVKEAVEIMEKMARLTPRKEKRIWISPQGSPLTPQTVTFKVRDFLLLVAEQQDWHFNTHQFRRYFALYYVRRFQGSLDALRRHYRHVTFDAIQAYVSDANGAKYMAAANSEVAREIVTDLIYGLGQYTSRSPLLAHHAFAKYRAANLPIEEIEAQMERFIKKEYKNVRATYWGYCLLQTGESEGAVCGGKEGRPDTNEMYPDNCGGCKYLAVGQEQIGYWQEFRSLHRKVLENTLSTPIAMRISQELVAKATGIIERANGV